MNPHAKWLREAAKICEKANLISIAHTCDQAANEIEALQAHRDNLLELHERNQSKQGESHPHGQNNL